VEFCESIPSNASGGGLGRDYLDDQQLATCINYADRNNSMLRMRGHGYAGFFRCDVLFL